MGTSGLWQRGPEGTEVGAWRAWVKVTNHMLVLEFEVPEGHLSGDVGVSTGVLPGVPGDTCGGLQSPFPGLRLPYPPSG